MKQTSARLFTRLNHLDTQKSLTYKATLLGPETRVVFYGFWNESDLSDIGYAF